MDKNAHYLIVGLFVILVTIAGVMFAGWLYNDHDNSQMRKYEVQFSESLDGLNIGNEVRYMGIKVGQVEKTYLIENQPDKVGIVISIKASTPVSQITVATLRTQGVTGLSYINLVTTQSKPKQTTAKALSINEQTQLPIINSAPSELGGLVHALPELQNNLNTLISGANAALSQKNLQTFSSLLENINQLAIDANQVFSHDNLHNLSALLESLNKTAAEGPKLIADLRMTTKKLNRLVSTMNQLVDVNKAGVKNSIKELQTTLNNVSKMTEHYSKLAVQLNTMATNNEEQINELLGSGGDLKQLLTESRKTATAIRRLSEKLEQNPSQIIYESTSQGVVIPQ